MATTNQPSAGSALWPYHVRWSDDDTIFVVMATCEEDARKRWAADRTEAGAMELLKQYAADAGQSFDMMVDCYALPALTNGVYYAERV